MIVRGQEWDGAPGAANTRARTVVLLVATCAKRRHVLGEALRRLELTVLAVASIAEIERWPRGAIVITEYARFSPLWAQVGAAHVLVLAETANDGEAARRRGASAWLPSDCSPEALTLAVSALHDLRGDTSLL